MDDDLRWWTPKSGNFIWRLKNLTPGLLNSCPCDPHVPFWSTKKSVLLLVTLYCFINNFLLRCRRRIMPLSLISTLRKICSVKWHFAVSELWKNWREFICQLTCRFSRGHFKRCYTWISEMSKSTHVTHRICLGLTIMVNMIAQLLVLKMLQIITAVIVCFNPKCQTSFWMAKIEILFLVEILQKSSVF